MMRKLCTPLLILLLVGALVIGWMSSADQIPSAPGTLVKLAEMPPYCAEDILFRAYWTDFLQYCDGYDILIFRSRENLISELDGWTHVSSITYEEMEQLAPRDLYSRVLNESGVRLPDSYTAYFLNSPFEKGDDFRMGDEFIFGLYDAASRICLIYRGHHLYGL